MYSINALIDVQGAPKDIILTCVYNWATFTVSPQFVLILFIYLFVFIDFYIFFL